jgi:hypothetical protein
MDKEALNDKFIKRYCSESFAAKISVIPESERECVLSGITRRHWFNGSPTDNDSQDIWLDVSEIEWQFEGDPADAFEDVSDFTIHGDLAYLYVGYGLSIEYDAAELDAAIQSYLAQ